MSRVLVIFKVPGRLRGKGRPRSAIRHGKNGGQFVQVYADKDTLSAEAMVRTIGAQAMGATPPFDGPLILKLEIVLNRPASWSKRKRAETVHVTGKPDCSNILKLVEDGLNGVLWRDDSQICEVHVRRRYDDTCGEHAKIWLMLPEGATVASQPFRIEGAELSLPLPPTPPKAKPKPKFFKVGDLVRSLPSGMKPAFDGVVLEADGGHAYVVQESPLGSSYVRDMSELELLE